MKMKTLAQACLALATAAFTAGAAHAADTVKIGFITDMSGLYAPSRVFSITNHVARHTASDATTTQAR